ncbi:dihydroneopterin aldolase [Candidatus Peribacteria bacterium]|nr:dihydroneopterin aldolase [Candidatus Peribacteria bacterium]
MNTLTIHDLELWTHIGVPEEERKTEQRILVTIELLSDLSPVGKTDDVTQGIDYEQLVHDVRVLAKIERKTIERLAEDIAAMILKSYKPESVKVSVLKQPLPGVRGVKATITRP